MNRKMLTARPSRREFLFNAGMGLGSVALTAMLADDANAASVLAPKPPHQPVAQKSASSTTARVVLGDVRKLGIACITWDVGPDEGTGVNPYGRHDGVCVDRMPLLFELKQVVSRVAAIMGGSGRTNPRGSAGGEEHPLALEAPAPLVLAT